ncbi:hypothetical protein B0H66DRAFT_603689 [Apodospora peruviana]|uniref:Uncharacterized protein n=1 Tax=Apodospora peruviana TaxID=516989 RepID=A0AAE0I5Z5_9PEZI|nr:hypothetical protein B0H66DRAFT_603689 [Apodospora peruviana]
MSYVMYALHLFSYSCAAAIFITTTTITPDFVPKKKKDYPAAPAASTCLASKRFEFNFMSSVCGT